MAKVCVRSLISGRVQGVGYRYNTQQQALQHQLTGWVRNLSDGRVEAWLEGEEEQVERMITWLRIGPPASKVEDVSCEKQPVQAFQEFKILR